MDIKPKDEVNAFEFPSVNNIVVYLLCIYVFIWYVQIGTRIDFLGKIRFEFLLGALLTLVSIYYFLSSKDKSTFLSKYIKLFFFVLIIQVPFSYDFNISLNFFIDRVVKFSLLALFIVSIIKSPWSLKLFIFAMLIAWLKLGQEAFLGWLSGSLVWQNQGIMRLHGSIPNLKHPNSLSGFGVSLLPFVYFLFPVYKKFGKLILSTLFIFSLVIIIFTGSRTGYVATLGFILYIFWGSKNKIKSILITFIILFVAFSYIPNQYIERFESIYTLEEKEGKSSSARIQIIKDAVFIFFKHPFGVGIHAFPKVRAEYFGRSADTHNLYLEVLTNLGFQGFIIFLLLIFSILKISKKTQYKLILIRENILKSEKRSKILISEINNIEFVLAVSKSITAYIIIRLYLGLFGMDLYEIYWWLAIGLVLSIYRISEYYDKQMNYVLKL